MPGWFSDVIFIIVACLLGLSAVGVVLLVVGYVDPLFSRMNRRNVNPGFKIHYKPCCPPGLGCNEKDRKSPCRRLLAYKLASPEETQQLDHHWSTYARSPSHEALVAWEVYRDDLVAEKIRGVEVPAKYKALLGATQTIEVVTGEVTGEEPHYPSDLYY